uniref:Mitochondrial import receptor subunit TOM20 homolog n=1 Tax=Clastoptera arizonana TaxID=38151 RepID=A0A1B6CWG7_9HEMI
MTMMSKTALGVAAGICGTIFVGYCIYFDRQRRKDPEFKKKLKERRRLKKLNNSTKGSSNSQFPDLKDPKSIQEFFLHEVQLGEELLGQGDVEGAVEHLSNAVAVCGQPNHLLQVLQQTLPQTVFHLLLQKLPTVSQKLISQSPASFGMMDDDVE